MILTQIQGEQTDLLSKRLRSNKNIDTEMFPPQKPRNRRKRKSKILTENEVSVKKI